MLNREWGGADIMKALDWLKRENFTGCDIYVRPARSVSSRLILVDDLNMGALARLQVGPYHAAVTVQTSPSNYQAWVKLDDDMSADVRREVARHLAREYGGDPNSADSAHYGRLAGFTNRKPEHIDAASRSPFVLLDSYNGRPASGAAELVQIARAVIEREQKQIRSVAAHVQMEARSLPQATTKTPQTAQELAAWYRSLWHSLKIQFGDEFDASRADWVAAVAMFRTGYDFQDVADVIAQHSPGIDSRKGAAVTDYVTRTAGKAEIWHELKSQGANYVDVADALLSLAQDRADNRRMGRNGRFERE
ncbi:DNA-primase RepB domain-containing protein [Verminephrobacter aporrectodeae]|nr:DNA-primase RepB domain-containing protein [Verminephrobacter aporrectodeae]